MYYSQLLPGQMLLHREVAVAAALLRIEDACKPVLVSPQDCTSLCRCGSWPLMAPAQPIQPTASRLSCQITAAVPGHTCPQLAPALQLHSAPASKAPTRPTVPQGLRLGDLTVGQPAHLRHTPGTSLGWAGAVRGCSALGSLPVGHYRLRCLHQRSFTCRLSPFRCWSLACVCDQGACPCSQSVGWSVAVISRLLLGIPHEAA